MSTCPPPKRLAKTPRLTLFRIVRAGQEDGVRHPWHRRGPEALAAAVAGGRELVVLGREPIVHVADELAALDEHAPRGLHPLVVDVEGAPRLEQRRVVNDGA